eukprot:TRINITY_DN5501_c0_g1_i1.p1 TRINITY_DN5501_c0_g1~~TRINITY_DN5501_c0_g1_i1.p1  ORF type:complete len:144 (-),score=11.70 TRINITY_DN5501_c0_g1_i1:59-490(-)
MECNDKCYEYTSKRDNGDLCSDTGPTPKHYGCNLASDEKCNVHLWPNTPFKNFMSYSDDDCMSEFTPQQVARMHCYLDLIYPKWMKETLPSFIPRSPQPTKANDLSSVTLVWPAPLRASGGLSSKGVDCDICHTNSILIQYST